MRRIRVRAPAKLNWTLEVLGKRSDGYHEIRSVMQTIGLADELTIEESNDLTLELRGEAGMLAGEAIEDNLALRAAKTLRGARRDGAHISLSKRIPIAAGLGGGSSDAAAVLRGLRAFWRLDVGAEQLVSIAASLGSDVPFFLTGGTALASGRGELVEALPDIPQQPVVVAWDAAGSPAPDKTAARYAALGPQHYSTGEQTRHFIQLIERGERPDAADTYNAFDEALSPNLASHRDWPGDSGSWSYCGSGPAMYYIARSDEEAQSVVRALLMRGSMNALATHTLPAHEATAIAEQA